jgi:hypothetical protein
VAGMLARCPLVAHLASPDLELASLCLVLEVRRRGEREAKRGRRGVGSARTSAGCSGPLSCSRRKSARAHDRDRLYLRAGSRRGPGTVGLRVKDPADVPLENAICSIFAHNRRLCDTPARLRRDLLGPDLGDVAEDLTPAHSRAHSGGTDRFASAPRNGARYRHHRTQRAALR